MKKTLAIVLVVLLITNVSSFAVNETKEQIKIQDRIQTSINELEQSQIRQELVNRIRLLEEAAEHQRLLTQEQTTLRFSDTEQHWAREQIMLAASWGLVNGYPDNSFRPDNPISGVEGILVLSRMAQIITGESAGAGDTIRVDLTRIPLWAREIIMEPAALRIAVQSNFYGESKLNRLMMTVMLAKSIGIESMNMPIDNVDFVDQDDIPEEYAGYIHALRLLGIVEGFEGRFEPMRLVNRGEAAAMMVRVLNMLEEKSPEVSIKEGKLIVELSENPTTGYSWSFSLDKVELLEPVENKFMESSQIGGLVGAGGTHRWVFRGLLEGEARLTFRYYRAWEGEKASIEERVYSVKIAKGGEITSAVLLVN